MQGNTDEGVYLRVRVDSRRFQEATNFLCRKILESRLLLLEATQFYGLGCNPPPLHSPIQKVRQHRQLAVNGCSARELVLICNGSALGFYAAPDAAPHGWLITPLLLVAFYAEGIDFRKRHLSEERNQVQHQSTPLFFDILSVGSGKLF